MSQQTRKQEGEMKDPYFHELMTPFPRKGVNFQKDSTHTTILFLLQGSQHNAQAPGTHIGTCLDDISFHTSKRFDPVSSRGKPLDPSSSVLKFFSVPNQRLPTCL